MVALFLGVTASHVSEAAQPATTQATVTLTSRAQDVSRLFCADPSGFDQIFSPTFRKAVPDAKLARILQNIFDTAGKCTAITPIDPLQPAKGKFTFAFADGSTAVVHLVIAVDSPHLVEGFFIEGLQKQAKSFDDVISQLKKLPGTSSLYAAQIDGTKLKPLAQFNADQPLALGSAFKLYVLAELVREIEAGQRHWDDVVHLTEQAKSLPGGNLQKWPVGSPFTIHTLAGLMISQSDNTATDQLIRLMGREKVESVLAVAGHCKPELNQPFLTTVEMFKLKGDPARKLADAYLSADETGKRAILDGAVAKMPREVIDFPSTPTHIDKIEWFASTNDLARAMLWLKSHSEASPTTEARQILSINPGLEFPKGAWDYIGYKGGSEPGVLNMTYLLRKGDRWFVVALTWNNPQKAVDEQALFVIVQQAVELSGK